MREDGVPKRQRIAEGAIAWKQGYAWNYIPPPWTQKKPITLKRGVIPLGAVNTAGRTPRETIQIIGRPPASVPELVSVDLGVVDIFIRNGRDITFKGGGEETIVGARIDSPTTGMDIDRELFPEPERRISRAKVSRKKKPSKKKRRVDWQDGGFGYTTVGGMRI